MFRAISPGAPIIWLPFLAIKKRKRRIVLWHSQSSSTSNRPIHRFKLLFEGLDSFSSLLAVLLKTLALGTFKAMTLYSFVRRKLTWYYIASDIDLARAMTCLILAIENRWQRSAMPNYRKSIHDQKDPIILTIRCSVSQSLQAEDARTNTAGIMPELSLPLLI
jgi:hypothetical protein